MSAVRATTATTARAMAAPWRCGTATAAHISCINLMVRDVVVELWVRGTDGQRPGGSGAGYISSSSPTLSGSVQQRVWACGNLDMLKTLDSREV